MPQPHPRHQTGFNDIQVLQRHIMFKQMQEVQRQQQLQELGDARQQNYANQLSMINKQASGGQFPPLINGTPIHDTSQIFMVGNMNLVQRSASPVVQGFSNGLAFSQPQSQAPRSMSVVPQQLDVSLYGIPIGSAGNNLNPYSPLQVASHDSVNVLSKGINNQVEKPLMQSSTFSNSFMRDQCNVSSDQVCMPDEAFMSKQVFHENSLFGEVPIQGFDSEILPANFQRVNTLQRNASVQEFGRRQEQAGWPARFPGKTTKVGPSQGSASLDPLEEKILFNMDDNSWEASFGTRSNMGTGGFENTLEQTDYLSAFPSIQSGSWSALMQSAVAEASSSDTGLQEEWSGLSFQNPELSTDNQPSNFVDSGKQQNNWLDNNLQSASALSSKPELLFNDSNLSSSFHGFQQSGIRFSNKQREGIRSHSSHESIQLSPKNATNWFDCIPRQKQPIEGNQQVQTLPSLQHGWPGQNNDCPEGDVRQPSQPSMSSYTSCSQPCNNLTGDINEAAHRGPSSLSMTVNNHVEGSFSGSVGGLELLKPGENSQLNSFSAVPKSSMNKVDRMVDQETRLSGDYCFQRENSNDSHHSNGLLHTITEHELRRNVRLHGSNSQHVVGGNRKTSAQVVRQQVPQGLSDHEKGYIRQFKLVGNVPNSGMELEKRRLFDIQRNSRTLEEASPRSNVGAISAFFDRSEGFQGPNVTAKTSQNMLELLNQVDSTDSTPLSEVRHAETPDASAAQSYNNSSASQCFGLKLAPSSQQLPSSKCFSSAQSSGQMGNATATSPSGHPYATNQLQDQQLPAATLACQSPQGTLPGMEGWFPGFNSATSQATPHMIHSNNYSQQFPILEALPVPKPSVMSGMVQQVGYSIRPPNIWTNVPTQRHLSGPEPQKVISSLLRPPDPMDSSLGTASGASQEVQAQNSLKLGNNSHEFGAYSANAQGFEYGGEQSGKERYHQQISSEILDPVSQTGGLSHGQDFVAKHLSEVNPVASDLSMSNSHQQGFDRAQYSESQAPAISSRDFEAFGRSLKPSHALHQNYSLLQQVHSLNNLETDPSKRVSAGKNGVDSNLNSQQQQFFYGRNSGFRNLVNSGLNVVSHLNTLTSGDNKVLSFFPEGRGDQSVKTSSQPLLQDTSQEMVTIGQNDSRNQSISNDVACGRTEQSHISMQMAPSWFKNYGTLKKRQMLPMYDARVAKIASQQFSLGKPFENLHMNSSMVRVDSASASQVSGVWPATATTSAAVKHLSPPYVLPSDVIDQNLAVSRPKKRKIAACELLPWHKEVTQGSQRLQNFSKAELEWAQSANRLIEKVDDDPDMIEDVLPVLRPKKRLILTTQLMQQVFRPAPAIILSAEATSYCDSVAYFAARVALGDACSLANDSHKPSDTCEISSEKSKTSDGIGEQDYSKIVEHLINQVKRLEGDLLRLDKKSSILDIRVESQELEKFSVFNRLAKFHSRGQADAASSSGTSPTVLKTLPQRYVTALPMPRTVPEEVHCLSL